LSTRNVHLYEHGRRCYGFEAEFPFLDDTKATIVDGIINAIWHHLLDDKTFIDPLGGVIAENDGFYANAYRFLLLGGWLEDKNWLVALRGWKTPIEAAARFGKRVNVVAGQKELMHLAGFVQLNGNIFEMQCTLKGYTLRPVYH
ncbi:hypothetical protein N7513_003912, partial [Penicillium frequentans]